MTASDIVRFFDFIEVVGECHLWTGSISNGYGQFTLDGKSEQAHRVAWLIAKGEWPKGYALHVRECPNRNCVREEHLYDGTHQENMDDLMASGRWANGAVKQTHCRQGHEFTPENTRIRADNGVQVCRACDRARQKKSYSKKPA